MKRLKIVHIIPSLKIGGAERLALEICKELSKNYHLDVKLITFLGEIKSQHSFHIHINSNYVPSITSKAKENLFEIQNFINDFSPDIIHSHLWKTEILLTKIETGNAKRFSHFHDNIVQLRHNVFPIKKKEITNFYEKNLFIKNNQNSFICISNDTLKYAKKVLPKKLKNNTLLLPNAINYNQFYSNKKKNLDEIRLINIGSFVEKKNQMFGLHIVKKLASMGYKTKIMFLGDGHKLKECEKIAKKIGVYENVQFTGNVDDVKPYLEQSNIYLHTAKYEPFGLVLLEAMAAGLPIVCLDGKGNRDFITHNKNGFIFKNENVESFVKSIIKLRNDKKLFNIITQNGRITALKYDIKNYVYQLLQIYSSSIKD